MLQVYIENSSRRGKTIQRVLSHPISGANIFYVLRKTKFARHIFGPMVVDSWANRFGANGCGVFFEPAAADES